MSPFGGNSAGGNDAGFFRQMAQRNVASRPPRPAGNAAGGLGGAPRPPAPAPRPPMGGNAVSMPVPPRPPVPMGNAPMGNAPVGNSGFNAPGGGPNTPGLGAGADPGGMLFFGLPQGTEELFGAAPTGFNKTLRPGNKMPGGMPGIF
jgi:hypothetical protein